MGNGRSLLSDPHFLSLARQYESSITPPRRATIDDVINGCWHVLILVPRRERLAIKRAADDLHLPFYLPMRQYVVQGRRGLSPHAIGSFRRLRLCSCAEDQRLLGAAQRVRRRARDHDRGGHERYPRGYPARAD